MSLGSLAKVLLWMMEMEQLLRYKCSRKGKDEKLECERVRKKLWLKFNCKVCCENPVGTKVKLRLLQ